MSIKLFRKKYFNAKNSNANVRLAMIDLLGNSSADYTTERMNGHLYKCGMSTNEGAIYKIFLALEKEGVVIFVGHIPIYTANNKVYIGTDPVFGLIK
jgi:hypothetical protein